MKEESKLVNTIVGLAAIGAAFIGVVGFIAALFPFFNEDYAAAGLFFIASALAFGLLSIAVLGK